MSVQELIDQLNLVEDKEAEIEMCVMSNDLLDVHYGSCDSIKVNTDGNTLELWEKGFYTE